MHVAVDVRDVIAKNVNSDLSLGKTGVEATVKKVVLN